MTQMECEQEQSEHVKTRHEIVLEPVNHHGIHVVMPKGISLQQAKAAIRHSDGEMGEMINDKRQHNQTAHDHVTRGECGLHVSSVDIRLGSGATILNREQDREVNVKNNSDEKKNSNQPKKRTQIAQMLRVTVDPIRSNKNLQIPQQMSDHKKDQNDAGDRDDHFFPNRGAIKS